MKILLINPPYHRLKEMKDIFFPLGIGYLAAYLGKNDSSREVQLYNVENPSAEEAGRFLNSAKLIASSGIFERNYADDDFHIWKEVREVIESVQPDIVGLTVMSCKYRPAVKITEIVKSVSRDIVTVWGGPHCSASGEEALRLNQCVDFVITNEGEEAFEELVVCLEGSASAVFAPGQGSPLRGVRNLLYRDVGEVRRNPVGSTIANLDDLPFPVRGADVFQERYPQGKLNTIMASRGCPFECKFCDSQNVWGRTVRYRSTENILAEIRGLNEDHAADVVNFCDDTFTLNKAKTMQFCEALAESDLEVGWTCTTRLDVLSDELCEAMKKSGVVSVTCGVESGSDRILTAIKKAITVDEIKAGIRLLEKHGIDWSGFFMLGFPTETREDIELTRKLWSEIRPSTIYLSIFTPYPGSELCAETEELGLLPDNPDWSSFSHQNLNNHFMVNISKSEFEEIAGEMFGLVEKYNSSFATLARKAYHRRRHYLRHSGEFVSTVSGKLRYKVQQLMGA